MITEYLLEMVVIDWGHITYVEAWKAQERLVEERLLGLRREDIVVFAEHESVYTMGRRAEGENILVGKDTLRRIAPLYEVNRGGDITYHGPGQLMVYFICHLSLFNYDVHFMLRWIEGVCIDVLREFGIEAYRVLKKTGVFCRGKKIVSIGLGFKKWVSFHGLAFNIDPELSFFSYIRPCGIDVEMTSVARELNRKVEIKEVKQILIGTLRCAEKDISYDSKKTMAT